MKKMTALFLVLCFALSLSTTAFADEGDKSVKIAVATDMHYLSAQLVDGGELIYEVAVNGDGKMNHISREIAEAFVYEMAQLKPDFLIIRLLDSGYQTQRGSRSRAENDSSVPLTSSSPIGKSSLSSV